MYMARSYEGEKKNWKKTKKKTNATRSSQAVTHLSTIRARRCLTFVIGRERVVPTRFEHWLETYILLYHIVLQYNLLIDYLTT